MFKIFSLIFASILMLSGCDNKSPEEIGYGVIKDGVYNNSYFNMSIKLPENWALQSKAAEKELMNTGAELLAHDNDTLKRIIKASEEKTLNIFSIFKYEQGSPVPFNPSVLAMAENVMNMPGIKRGSDYFFHMKKLLKASQMKYKFTKEIYSNKISGVSFDILPTEIDVGNATIYQKYYATRIKDYVLGFVLTYTSDVEENELNGIINNLKFSK